jgi:hypothetical protein
MKSIVSGGTPLGPRVRFVDFWVDGSVNALKPKNN